MKSHGSINVCAQPEYRLTSALLCYESTGGAVVTKHPVTVTEQGPEIGAGSLITHEELEAALKTVRREEVGGAFVSTELLYLSSEKVAWWVKAHHRPLYFKTKDATVTALSGKPVWNPPLVFVARGNHLRVFALAANRRPGPATRLHRTPHWNVGDCGAMCAGSVDLPERATHANTSAFTEAFFRSFFTHANGASALTTHPKGFTGLWQEQVAQQTRFDPKWLVASKLTLRDAVAE